jgi:hypothetical protein
MVFDSLNIMKVYNTFNRKKDVKRKGVVLKKGSAIVNKLIDKLPIELHLPGYNFCGPGTKLTKRLARGDSGVNLLDLACKVHDIAYSETTDLNKRHEADKVLIEKARERLKAKDSSFGEKAAAATVLGILKAKVKLGMGSRKRSKRSKKSKRGRILVATKSGGFLLFLLSLLGAHGALGGGAAGIATAVNKAKSDKQLLEETQRHNKAMETISSITKRKGMRKKRKSVDKEKDYMLDHINGIKKTTDKITTSCID